MARNLQQKKEQLPSVIDFSQDASDGLDNLSAADFAIPYLVILQKMSPQLDTHDVKAGQIWNTVTEKGVDSIHVVPCAYTRNFVEWVPREQGGGLVAARSASMEPRSRQNVPRLRRRSDCVCQCEAPILYSDFCV